MLRSLGCLRRRCEQAPVDSQVHLPRLRFGALCSLGCLRRRCEQAPVARLVCLARLLFLVGFVGGCAPGDHEYPSNTRRAQNHSQKRDFSPETRSVGGGVGVSVCVAEPTNPFPKTILRNPD